MWFVEFPLPKCQIFELFYSLSQSPMKYGILLSCSIGEKSKALEVEYLAKVPWLISKKAILAPTHSLPKVSPGPFC